jgi:hypothetical protein
MDVKWQFGVKMGLYLKTKKVQKAAGGLLTKDTKPHPKSK